MYGILQCQPVLLKFTNISQDRRHIHFVRFSTGLEPKLSFKRCKTALE